MALSIRSIRHWLNKQITATSLLIKPLPGASHRLKTQAPTADPRPHNQEWFKSHQAPGPAPNRPDSQPTEANGGSYAGLSHARAVLPLACSHEGSVAAHDSCLRKRHRGV